PSTMSSGGARSSSASSSRPGSGSAISRGSCGASRGSGGSTGSAPSGSARPRVSPSAPPRGRRAGIRPPGWCSARRRRDDVRIAYVIPAYPPAASQPFVVNEMVEVQAAGHEVVLLPLYATPPSAVRHATFERFRPAAVLPPAMLSVRDVLVAVAVL